MISVKDIAWLAGLLEGEGCFRSVGNCPTIKLSMTDRDTVVRAAGLLGLTHIATVIHKNPTYKDAWVIAANGRTAAGWMMTIWPLMGARRQEKITEMLKCWKSAALWQRYRVQCKYGHLLSGPNLYQYPGTSVRHGQRQCKACRRQHYRKAYQKKCAKKLVAIGG